MPKIDVTRFMEQSGMRKARFGGYEPDDVRAALQALCTEYEQRLGRAEAQARKAEQENAALQQHCQTLTAQNNRLSGQNAALAGSSSTYSRQKESLDAQVSALQERNHSLNDQVAVLRLTMYESQKTLLFKKKGRRRGTIPLAMIEYYTLQMCQKQGKAATRIDKSNYIFLCSTAKL